MLDSCWIIGSWKRHRLRLSASKKRFSAETSYKEVPAFWGEWMSDMKGLKGMFGVCSDMDGKTFDYWIADLYEPWKDIPAGCCTYQISGRRI